MLGRIERIVIATSCFLFFKLISATFLALLTAPTRTVPKSVTLGVAVSFAGTGVSVAVAVIVAVAVAV